MSRLKAIWKLSVHSYQNPNYRTWVRQFPGGSGIPPYRLMGEIEEGSQEGRTVEVLLNRPSMMLNICQGMIAWIAIRTGRSMESVIEQLLEVIKEAEK